MKRRAWYSILQFCPSSDRKEGLNIGVIIMIPDYGWHCVVCPNLERLRRVFGDEADLSAAEQISLIQRIHEADATVEGMLVFTNSEAGQLRMTPPAPMVIENVERDAQALFDRLVEAPVPVPEVAQGSTRNRNRTPAR